MGPSPHEVAPSARKAAAPSADRVRSFRVSQEIHETPLSLVVGPSPYARAPLQHLVGRPFSDQGWGALTPTPAPLQCQGALRTGSSPRSPAQPKAQTTTWRTVAATATSLAPPPQPQPPRPGSTAPSASAPGEGVRGLKSGQPPRPMKCAAPSACATRQQGVAGGLPPQPGAPSAPCGPLQHRVAGNRHLASYRGAPSAPPGRPFSRPQPPSLPRPRPLQPPRRRPFSRRGRCGGRPGRRPPRPPWVPPLQHAPPGNAGWPYTTRPSTPLCGAALYLYHPRGPACAPYGAL